MAARQDQGLQIALIILIFLFIVSAVVAYLGWKGYGEADQRATELSNQLRDAQTQVGNLQTQNEDMRDWIGVGRTDNFEDVKKVYEDDMTAYGQAVADEDRRRYRTALESVFKEGRNTAAREFEAKNEVKELTSRLQAIEAENEKQLAQYQEQLKKKEADAASERNKFTEFRSQLEQDKKDLLSNLEKQRAELEGEIGTRDTTIKERETKIAELTRAVQHWREQVPKDTESFEVADGRIAWVNQDGTVWINVGEADSLRRQVTFNVYDADEHDADRAVKKASIEVTRLMGDHMAEARVTEDTPTNPILTGDNIYSPVWHRGKKLRFALTGLVDIDDDGASDLQLARDLITLNGGSVDAYLGDDGKMVGEITAHTRYLVLGHVPESAARANLQTGYQEMSKIATELGIETITLDQFLNQMGYKPGDRTVRLGAGATARDVPVDPESTPEIEGKPSQSRPRTPYRAKVTTPY
jgi:hypothetical protein